MSFDAKLYTVNSLVEELALLERHINDGSYLLCGCAPEKHLPLIAGLSSEAVRIVAIDETEKHFYQTIADLARKWRKDIQAGTFKHPKGGYAGVHRANNPNPRRYAPYAWTSCEKRHPMVKRKIQSCASQIEKTQTCPPSQWGTSKTCVNPYAVCRASIPCPPK